MIIFFLAANFELKESSWLSHLVCSLLRY